MFLLSAAVMVALPSCSDDDGDGTTPGGTSQTDTTSVIIATRYVQADGHTDVTNDLQRLINEHPNRTIYFPDGVYKITRPLRTPADPKKSVMLVLSNYAQIQAAGDWTDGEAMIQLGGSHAANDINTPGSNYGLRGGILEGAGVANGVSIDGGRETTIQNVAIKNVKVGIHIKPGANNGSSDADVRDVNIVCNNTQSSVGLLVEGYDNTFTNIRIASVNVGVQLKSSGNILRNVHPLYVAGAQQNYASTRGFVVEQSNNWLDFCYSDTFAKAFYLGKDVKVNMTNCFTMWYTGWDQPEVAIWCEGRFNSVVSTFRADFRNDQPVKSYTLLHAATGGSGTMSQTIYPNVRLTDDISARHIVVK